MHATQPRRLQSYDPRLRHLIRTTRDVRLGASLGIPSSTLLGWLSTEYRPVVSLDVCDLDTVELQVEVVKLRKRTQKLAAIIRLLVALLQALGVRLGQQRLPEGRAKSILLRAVERTQIVLSLRVHSRSCDCHRLAIINGDGTSKGVGSTTS